MNPGYFSEQAVKDLLAIKNGEIDFLKKRIDNLTIERNSLADELTQLHKLKGNCSNT